MKKVLAILVVIAFVAALSSAATYTPVKDSFYRFDSNGGANTYGGADQQRVGKYLNQDGFYMDFDRAQIQADVTAALGHPFTAADVTSGAVTVSLALCSGGWGPISDVTAQYTPGYWTSSTAWTESGASWLFADQANSVKWNGTGASIGDNNQHLAAAGGQAWGAPAEQYANFSIGADIAAGYLFATDAGVALQMYGLDGKNNGNCYSREGTHTLFGSTVYAGPVLTVSVVPEPCSMLLIAAGAVATLIRRRK